jgi:hypothetical protein
MVSHLPAIDCRYSGNRQLIAGLPTMSHSVLSTTILYLFAEKRGTRSTGIVA